MSQIEKKIKKMRDNPKSVTFEELKSILEHYGFLVENQSGGSHYSVFHPQYNLFDAMEPNTIPKKRPHILPCYVKRAVVWIERVIEIEKEY